MSFEKLYFGIEFCGVIIFAVSGVLTALEKKLDAFGAITLGLVTAVGGGIIRDMILGFLPPTAFRDPTFSITAIVVSIITFAVAYFAGAEIKPHFDIYSRIINVIDSVGLAFFTISGVNMASQCGFGGNLYLSVFVGVLTGVGGGVMRDVFAGKIPMIMYKRVYALAALIGAIVYQVITEHGLMHRIPAVICSAVLIIAIRMLATVFRWHLPKVKNLDDDTEDNG